MEDLYDTIEQYVLGKMPEGEKAEFEARMNADPALQDEVAAFRVAREILETGIADSLRADFAGWQSAKAGPKPARRAFLRVHSRVWAVAASLLLLLGIFGYWRVSQYSGDTLAANFYDSSELTTVRSAPAGQGELDAGLSALRAGNFEAAATAFQAFEPSNPYYIDAQYLLANTWYQSGKLNDAETILQQLQTNSDPVISEKADWLLLLAYLKDGRKGNPETIQLLDKISADPGHSFYPKAAELKRELGRFWSGWSR
ncbi:MAG TPA: tetratricopeptide repeat protein [Flavilitoribacter sp.]|nr:tetratricopeptide repeat protein [Flavilitoribacter sp.]